MMDSPYTPYSSASPAAPVSNGVHDDRLAGFTQLSSRHRDQGDQGRNESSAYDNAKAQKVPPWLQQGGTHPGALLLGLMFLITIYLWIFHRSVRDEGLPEGKAFQLVTAALHEHFPGALPASQMVKRSDDGLIAYGFSTEKTLFAESTCPDEINHQNGGILDLFRSHWGNAEFFLGGLAGIPFSGKAGFNAFSAHVPEDGTIFLLFAPHVSVDEDGKVGKYHRKGQRGEPSTACGAAISAFNSLKAALLGGGGKRDAQIRKAQAKANALDIHDYQIQFITQKVNAKLEVILKSKDPIVTLTMKIYDVIQAFVLEIINLDHKIALLGGIQINIPLDSVEDHFLPLYFKIHEKNKKPIDIVSYVDDQLEEHPHPMKKRHEGIKAHRERGT